MSGSVTTTFLFGEVVDVTGLRPAWGVVLCNTKAVCHLLMDQPLFLLQLFGSRYRYPHGLKHNWIRLFSQSLLRCSTRASSQCLKKPYAFNWSPALRLCWRCPAQWLRPAKKCFRAAGLRPAWGVVLGWAPIPTLLSCPVEEQSASAASAACGWDKGRAGGQLLAKPVGSSQIGFPIDENGGNQISLRSFMTR